MIYELRKIESNWSLNELSRCWSAKKKRQQVFQPNRNAFQVRLLLFRQVANRNQIPILVQETTAAVRFAGPDQPVSNFPFYSNRPPFAQNGTSKMRLLTTILLCHPAATPKRTNRRISFWSFAYSVANWATAGLLYNTVVVASMCVILQRPPPFGFKIARPIFICPLFCLIHR